MHADRALKCARAPTVALSQRALQSRAVVGQEMSSIESHPTNVTVRSRSASDTQLVRAFGTVPAGETALLSALGHAVSYGQDQNDGRLGSPTVNVNSRSGWKRSFQRGGLTRSR